MLALRLTFDDAGVGAAFASLQKATGDLRPALRDIGNELDRTTRERFTTNVSPDGQPWPQSLRAKVTGLPTLVDSGNLLHGIDFRVEGDSAVSVGTNGFGGSGDYAAIHQLGGTISAKGKALRFRLATGEFVATKSVRIPPRPYLGLSHADRETIPDIVLDHWNRALRGAFTGPSSGR